MATFCFHFIVFLIIVTSAAQELDLSDDDDECGASSQRKTYSQHSIYTPQIFFDYDNFDEALFLTQNNTFVPQIPTLTEKRCRYRDFPPLYPSDLWVYLTSGACFFFTNPVRFTCRNITRGFDMWNRNKENFPIPYIIHPADGSQFFFNYKDTESVMKHVSPLFIDRLSLNQWIQCSADAVECCSNVLNETNIIPTDEFPCPAIWDGWSCMPQAQAGETIKLWCPPFIYTGEENVCHMENVIRHCSEDGNWILEGGYEDCSLLSMRIRRNEFHVLVLIISIPFTIPAVFILLFFQKLRTLRLILINSLLIAIILRTILTIIAKEVVVLGHFRFEIYEFCEETGQNYTMVEKNPIGCRILAYFENVSVNFIFTLMLINAFYLHKTIVRVFRSDPNIYATFAVATVLSVIPSTIWATLMGENDVRACWMFAENYGFSWVFNGYRYFVLAVNVLLLLDILRLLFFKRMKNNTRQVRSAIKGSLFLIPLFGGHILLVNLLFLFNTSTCLLEDVFIYISYLVEASQGVLVAFFFCYLNYEVHREIQNANRKLSLALESRYGIKFRKSGDFKRTMAATESTDHTRTSTLNRDSVTEDAVKDWLSDRKAPRS